MLYSQNIKKNNSYKFAFLTFEAANKARRYKRNRQISYGRNQLHQKDQTSKLTSYLTGLLIYFAGAGSGAPLSLRAPTHVSTVLTG
jgi:hypothetical protein